MLERGMAPDIVQENLFPYRLLVDSMPDAWCLEGIVIVVPKVIVTDKDGMGYVFILQEIGDGRCREWTMDLFAIDEEFGQNFYFLKAEHLSARK